MPVRHNPQPLFRALSTPEAVAARGGRPAAGMFLSSGDPTTAEICAGAGLDYLLIDAEHAPLTLQDVLAQLRTIAGYRVPTLVRVPALDTVAIKQFLDLGAQTLLVPMVDDAAMARSAVAAAGGVRGGGSARGRSGRWSRIPGYLPGAADHVSVIVQIETAAGVRNADEIAAVDGIDGVFIGPSDLSASLGLLGQQSHPEVVAAVEEVITKVKAAGKIVGVNAFVPAQADAYAAAGADYLNVGADVALLARAAEALADRWCPEPSDAAADGEGAPRTSY